MNNEREGFDKFSVHGEIFDICKSERGEFYRVVDVDKRIAELEARLAEAQGSYEASISRLADKADALEFKAESFEEDNRKLEQTNRELEAQLCSALAANAVTCQANLQVQQTNRELGEAIQASLRIKDIWIPIICGEEHRGEAEALHAMHDRFLEALANSGTPKPDSRDERIAELVEALRDSRDHIVDLNDGHITPFVRSIDEAIAKAGG